MNISGTSTPEDSSPPQSSSPYRIIVVDEDRGTREFLAGALADRGYEVATVADRNEAVQTVKKRKFHLAITDIKASGLIEIDTIDAIKKVDPDIEMIVTTGRGLERLGSEAMRRGAYAHLVKPFELLELEALIPGARDKTGLESLVGLYEATRSVFADAEMKDLFPKMTAVAKKILAADDATLMLLGEDSRLRIVASSKLDEKTWRTVEIPLGERVAGRVAQWKTGVTINGPLEADPRFDGLQSQKGIQISLVYPILLKGELLGILNVSRKEGRDPFLPQDLRHAAIFCSQIAQSIENARIYGKLEAARKEAIEANALKDELLHMTTHDLKSPLNAIQGYTEKLLDPGTDDKMKLSCAEGIQRAVKNSFLLVKRILRKGLLESAEFKLDLKPTPVCQLIDECFKDFDVLVRKKGMRLVKNSRLPRGYEINVDPAALQEIVANLVSNAIKFCDSGDEIGVAMESGGGKFILSVSDTGPGIPPEEQKGIFEKFRRGTSAKSGGTGIGLSIVRRLVELHGGRVELVSNPGKGTTFKVFLPEQYGARH